MSGHVWERKYARTSWRCSRCGALTPCTKSDRRPAWNRRVPIRQDGSPRSPYGSCDEVLVCSVLES